MNIEEAIEILNEVLDKKDCATSYNVSFGITERELEAIKTLISEYDLMFAEFDRLEDIEDDRDCNYVHKKVIKDEIEKCSKLRGNLEFGEWYYKEQILRKLIGE